MSRSKAPIPSLNESMMSMRMMDGQDIPRSDEIRSLPARGAPSSSSKQKSPLVDLSQYSGLKEHMARYSAYFDSSIPEEERVQWAIDNLPSEFLEFEEKRLKFEQEREEWAREMDVLRDARLHILREQVVKMWIYKEENNWEDSRRSWGNQKRTIEEMLKMDLERLSREAEKIRKTGDPINPPIPPRASPVFVPRNHSLHWG